MPPKRTINEQSGLEEVELRTPRILTIKDLITIISITVSLAIAWGVFDTRVTVLEKAAVRQEATDAQQARDTAEIKAQIQKSQLRQQEDAQNIDDLYRSMHKPLPRRSDSRD